MNTISIIHSLQLSRSTLLVVIEDAANGKRDAVLITISYFDVIQPEYIKKLEQSILWPDNIQSNKNCVEISFEIEENLLDEVNSFCANLGIQTEQLILAFIRFCTSKDNYPALKEFIEINSIMIELDEIKNDMQLLQAEILETKKCLNEEQKKWMI